MLTRLNLLTKHRSFHPFYQHFYMKYVRPKIITVFCYTFQDFTLLKFECNHNTLQVSTCMFKFNTKGAVKRVL